MQGGGFAIESVNPIIKLVKQREELFFQLLSFVTKNIESSSNDLDNLTIFNKFVPPFKQGHQALCDREQHFLAGFEGQPPSPGFLEHADEPVSKEMLRLSSRVIEMLEASVARVRKGIFDEGGRASKDFTRFKIMLHKILKKQPFLLHDYLVLTLNYTNNKFQRQITKLEKYLTKLSDGEDISLRDLYLKRASDVELSPEEKPKVEHRVLKKQEIKLDIQIQHHSEEKKTTRPKRNAKSSLKRREKAQSSRPKPKQQQSEEEQKPTKQQTANKLLKFYALLELNKKQFLEDYIYNKVEEEKHRTELLGKLFERNKLINSQINNYVRKSCVHIPVPVIIMPPPNRSSGDQRNQSMTSKVSLRTSFIISKRKASFHQDSSSGGERYALEKEKQSVEKTTIKNMNPRRSSHSTQRPKEKSKKLFVVKQPMVFEDEIPQAQITQTQWLQTPFTVKKDARRNESIRLKRKNNPNPLQTTNFPQHFRYPF